MNNASLKDITIFSKRRRKQRVLSGLCFLSTLFILCILCFFLIVLFAQAHRALFHYTIQNKPVQPAVDTYLKTGQSLTLLPQEKKEIDRLSHSGAFQRKITWSFFYQGDSPVPERAGILSSLAGSLLILCVTACLGLSFGITSALYLEEFSSKGRLMRFIELNILNLASVPPVLFGVFGLFVFLGCMNMPRSAVLVSGLVLTMVILPSIIVVSRQAIASVPLSIRHGALALGASRMQVVFHHILPLAMPRILTGSLIALVRSFGETSPLLMVGAVAFIRDVPKGFLDPATTVPIQIYMWANNPNTVFVWKAAAAVLVLLFFLVMLNFLAFWLRGYFERMR